MKHALALLTVVLLAYPICGFAQVTSEEIIDSSTNPESLLPRIYASDINISSGANDHTVIGTFLITNGEQATVGGIQYEVMLLDPLGYAPIGELVADNPNVHDRILSKEIFVLQAQEKRTISFVYQAPNVPQGLYRIRIQITTTNDRLLGWVDGSLTMGGADTFVVVEPRNVQVDSVDPITKEHNTIWQPLYGVNVNPMSKLVFSAMLKNPLSKKAIGRIAITTKRLLYANEKSITTQGNTISILPNSSKQVQIPLITKKDPGAYIIFITGVDASGKRISGVAEYRYVVRGQSASVASVQLKSIPAAEKGLAHVAFVLGGSADRNTPVSGKMHITITDSKGIVGSIEKDFSIPSAFPATGSAYITMQRTLCGTPAVEILLLSVSGLQLDKYSVDASTFANPTCKKPFLSFMTKSVGNTALAILAIITTRVLWVYRKKH